MPEAIAAGTAQGLIDYLDYLVEKGYAPTSAVNPWKSAAKVVFSTVEGDNYESLDLRSLDIDEYMDRYATISRGKLKRESVIAYRQRVRKALDSYREYLDNPDGWQPPSLRTTPRKRPSGEQPASTGKAAPNGNGVSQGHDNAGSTPALIDYPFPLRSGQLAHVRLPARLEKMDADRLGTFIQTLVFEPQRQIPERVGAEADS